MKNILFILICLSLYSCSFMQSIPTWIDENSETDTLQIEAGDFIEGGKAPIYTSLSPDLSSDSLIYLANPSFEESPAGHSRVPSGWLNCNEFNESPPDLHLSNAGSFGVKTVASHGKQFLGLVMRDNHTYEAITQKLYFDLVENKTYQFNLDITYSDKLKSLSKTSMKEEYFTEPGVLRIWVGNDRGDKSHLVYRTPIIDHKQWKTCNVKFKVPENVSYLIFEVHYEDPYRSKNGNILIDNISPIYKINKQ